MSQPIDELPFDYVVEEAERLIGGDREWPDRTQATERPIDQPAFPSPAAAQATAIFPAPAANHWQQSPSGNDSSESSPVVSTQPSISAFGYTSQHDSPNPYMDTYVSPMSLQNTSIPGLDFIPWPRIGTGDLIDNMGTGTSQSVVLASPALSYEPLVGTPEGGFSDSDLAAFMDLPDMTQQQSRLQEPTQPGYGTQGTEFGESSSHSKHTKKSAKQDVAAARSLPSGSNRRLAAAATVIVPENINTADSRGKTKLRSASRSSKNIQIRFAETVEERKTRNSHNLVEKQYRNRLNAQFESLLNTLPDAVRSPESSSGPGNLDPAFDFGDKKLSKGEVLDLSMRYIRALERDCGRLEREREELKRTVNELQGAVRDSCMSGPDGSGGGSGAVLR